MIIKAVDKDSIAEELGVRPGDVLHQVNGQKVGDVLDYRFFIAEEFVEIAVSRNDEITIFEIEKDHDDPLGLHFEPMTVRQCGNDCPFCFVDQNPAGMRSGVYFRDEDFRFSFLEGHYVTLTNISKRDLQRIADQHLSPLYISVHAFDSKIRKFLLGLRHDDKLIEKLDFLTSNDIELHTQIVLCPGHNDGAVLQDTMQRLAKYFPKIRTAAIVPLGLTGHREGLTKLQPVDRDYAQKLIAEVNETALDFKKKLGVYFAYPSDEFYIIARQPLPPLERYDSVDQLENGVGMVKLFLNTFEDLQEFLPDKIMEQKRITLVTGTLMHDILQSKVLPRLNAIENLDVQLVMVKNDFYGESIRITGLLTGQDIYKNLQNRSLGEHVFLPKNCLNDENIFLDDWQLDDMQEKLKTPVSAISNDFGEIFDLLNIDLV